jgi:hypothetical protein
VTKLCGVCVFVLLLASAGVGYAADNAKNNGYRPILPTVDLDGGYSVNLNTEMPKPTELDAPPALSDLRQNSIQPFVGLRLSKPLDAN